MERKRLQGWGREGVFFQGFLRRGATPGPRKKKKRKTTAGKNYERKRRFSHFTNKR